jgi:hypothetical protein
MGSVSMAGSVNETARKWLIIALANFLVAACFGALMRYAFITEIPWFTYRNVLNAHSHTAMLGWVYQGLYALLLFSFQDLVADRLKFYKRLFWITQTAVIGMVLSYPVQGYGAVSIAFSTLHTLCAYGFIARFWKDLPRDGLPSMVLARTALFFFALSTIGLWLMGPLMVSPLRGSAVYYMSVQFFLHFQFNGWMVFAVLALVLRLIESTNIEIPARRGRLFYRLLVASTFLTFALAVAWSQPYLSVFIVNSIGVVIQLAALVVFLLVLRDVRQALTPLFTGIPGILVRIALWAFVAKIIIQTAVVLPFVAQIAYTIRNFVIGFIHLILLGVITAILLACGRKLKLLNMRSPLSILGVSLLGFGFASTEVVLFVQGVMFWAALGFLPHYDVLLFCLTVFLPAGILCLWLGQFRPKVKVGSAA